MRLHRNSGARTTGLMAPPGPPPYRQNIPRYNPYGHKKRKGNPCLRCICCCYCFIIILILFLAGLAYYYFSVYQPKVPTYKVESVQTKTFELTPDSSSVRTELLVSLKAENQNDHIGFNYGSNSSIVLSYKDTSLCSGKLPEFHQDQRNTTVMKITLKGETPLSPDLQQSLSEDKKSGKIPLVVAVKAPVNILVGEFPLRQFVVSINYYLAVDDLSPGKQPKIISSRYTVDVSF